MALTRCRQLIQTEIESLPEDLALEVLDFIQFLKSAGDEESFLWRQVERTYDHRRLHPDEVVTLSAEEWMKETVDQEAFAMSIHSHLGYNPKLGGGQLPILSSPP